MASDPGTQTYTIWTAYTPPSENEIPIGFIIHNKGIWQQSGTLAVPEYFVIGQSSPMIFGGVSMSIVQSKLNSNLCSFTLVTSSVLYDISKIEIAPIFASRLIQ